MKPTTVNKLSLTAFALFAAIGTPLLSEDTANSPREIWRTEYAFPNLDNFISLQTSAVFDGAAADVGGQQGRMVITPNDHVKCAMMSNIYDLVYDLNELISGQYALTPTDDDANFVFTEIEISGIYDKLSTWIKSQTKAGENLNFVVLENKTVIMRESKDLYYLWDDKLGDIDNFWNETAPEVYSQCLSFG